MTRLLLAAAVALASPAAAAAQPRVEVINLKWHLVPAGNAVIDELMLSSFSDLPIKDMTLKCTTYGRSGTALTEVTMTLFDKIAPKGVQYFRAVNLGPVNPQTSTLECEVIGARPD